MSTPERYDIAIVRGTTEPFVVRLKRKDADGNVAAVLFEDVRLSIGTKANLLLRVTLADGDLAITDASQGEVTWISTPEQSRLIPVGPKATYELEVRTGASQRVYLMGTITGLGGINDD